MTQEEQDYLDTTLVTLELLGFTIQKVSRPFTFTFYITQGGIKDLGSIHINNEPEGTSAAHDYRPSEKNSEFTNDIKKLCDWILKRF